MLSILAHICVFNNMLLPRILLRIIYRKYIGHIQGHVIDISPLRQYNKFKRTANSAVTRYFRFDVYFISKQTNTNDLRRTNFP